MKTERKFKLGEIVTAYLIYKRKSIFVRSKLNKYWRLDKLHAPKTVMIIGIRTLSNGTNESNGDEGVIYTPGFYFKALLVVENLNTKPFYIPLP